MCWTFEYDGKEMNYERDTKEEIIEVANIWWFEKVVEDYSDIKPHEVMSDYVTLIKSDSDGNVLEEHEHRVVFYNEPEYS